MHVTSTTHRSRILNYHYSEVSTLSFLREGNTSRISIDNASIKLKIIVSHKAFTLLSQEFSLLELQILHLSEIVVSHEQSIVSLKANDTKGVVTI
jgi:hypothetical protein